MKDTYELRRVVEEPAVAFCRVTRHSGIHPVQRDDSRQIQRLLGGPLDNSTNSTKHHGCLAPERSLEQYHGSGHLCTFSAGPKKTQQARKTCVWVFLLCAMYADATYSRTSTSCPRIKRFCDCARAKSKGVLGRPRDVMETAASNNAKDASRCQISLFPVCFSQPLSPYSAACPLIV